jgi:anaerobic magnesium-protoporphyrin IX monomethyl ester cyclase
MSRRRSRRPIVLYQPRDEGVRMPLGLLAVASAMPLEHVVLLDGRLDLAPEARVVELARDAACLGITVRTGQPLRDAVRISRAARTANPRLPVIWGGPHATLRPEQCLATGDVDACVVGAGEASLPACLAALRVESPLGDVPGVAVAGSEKVSSNAPPSPEEVRPAQYALLDLELYFRVRDGRRLDYSSSRGRRGKTEGGWWALPSERVVAEVSELADRHHLEAVLFQEEDFFGDPARVDALARGLVEEGRRIRWEVGARPEDILATGAERFNLLRESGCGRVHVLVAPGGALLGESRRTILEAGALLHRAGIAGRFVFYVEAPRPGYDGLAAADSVARALTRIDPRFETPLARRRVYPPETDLSSEEPADLEEWAEQEGEPWPNRRAERRLRRRLFYLTEAQRPAGRGFGKRLVHLLARARVRTGFFGFDLERVAVDVSTLLRTGKGYRVQQRE